MTKRAVIYLRISSTEQSVHNQQPELERVAQKAWRVELGVESRELRQFETSKR